MFSCYLLDAYARVFSAGEGIVCIHAVRQVSQPTVTRDDVNTDVLEKIGDLLRSWSALPLALW